MGLSKFGFVRNTDGAGVGDSDNELVDESSDGTRRFRLDPPKRDTELYPNSWLRGEAIDRGYIVNHFREETDGVEAPLRLLPSASKLVAGSKGAAEVGLAGRPIPGNLPPVGQMPPILQTDAPPENAPPKHEPATQLAGSTPAVVWYRRNVGYQRLTATVAAQGASLWNPSNATELKAAGANNSKHLRPRLLNPRQSIANTRGDTLSTPAGKNSSTLAPTGASNPVQETSSISQGSCALITESESSVQEPPLVTPSANSPTAQGRQRVLTEARQEDRIPFIGRVEVQAQGFSGDIQKALGLAKYQPISCDEKELKQIWLKVKIENAVVNVGENVLQGGWLEGAVPGPSVEYAPMGIDVISHCYPATAVIRPITFTKHCREWVKQGGDGMDSLLKQFDVVGEETDSAGEDYGDLWDEYIDNSTSRQQQWVQGLKIEDETELGSTCMEEPTLRDIMEAKVELADNKGSENTEEDPTELHCGAQEMEEMEEKCGPEEDKLHGRDGGYEGDTEKARDDSDRGGKEEGKTWRLCLRGGAGPDDAALDEDGREREALRLLWVGMGDRLATVGQRGLVTHDISRVEAMPPAAVGDGWERSLEYYPTPLSSLTTAVDLFSAGSAQLTPSASASENSPQRPVRNSLNVPPAQLLQRTAVPGVEELVSNQSLSNTGDQLQAHSTATVTGGPDGGSHSNARGAGAPSSLLANVVNLGRSRSHFPIPVLARPQITPPNSVVGDESLTISRGNSYGEIFSVDGRVAQENLRWLRTNIPQTPRGSMVSAFEDAVATGQVDENPEELARRLQAGNSESTQSMDVILHNAERVVHDVTCSYYQDPGVEGDVRRWLDRCQLEHRRRVELEVSLLRLRPGGLRIEEYQQMLLDRSERWARLYRLVAMGPRPYPSLTPIAENIDEEEGGVLLADAETETPLTLVPNRLPQRGTLDGVVEGFEDRVGDSDASMISPRCVLAISTLNKTVP